MGFIQKQLVKRYIADNKVDRKARVCALHKAVKVGILCNITTEDTYKEIYAVFDKLQTFADREVWLLGYVDSDAVPFYCHQQLKADFFCNKDLNWYGKPEKVQVTDFQKVDFDILLDFTHAPFAPIKMLLAVSPAHFIVGSEKSNAEYYDLLINTDAALSHQDLYRNIDQYTKNLTGEQ